MSLLGGEVGRCFIGLGVYLGSGLYRRTEMWAGEVRARPRLSESRELGLHREC